MIKNWETPYMNCDVKYYHYYYYGIQTKAGCLIPWKSKLTPSVSLNHYTHKNTRKKLINLMFKFLWTLTHPIWYSKQLIYRLFWRVCEILSCRQGCFNMWQNQREFLGINKRFTYIWSGGKPNKQINDSYVVGFLDSGKHRLLLTKKHHRIPCSTRIRRL